MSETDDPRLAEWLHAMPTRPGLPFEVSPARLYTVGALYAGLVLDDVSSFERTFDYQVYRWTQDAVRHPRIVRSDEVIATRLHDTALDSLIAQFLSPDTQKTIGFMGGHGVLRTGVAYRRVARMARELRRRGFMIVTGGGPGLMEAANFGAFMAPWSEAEFDAALDDLAVQPDCGTTKEERFQWVASAAKVRAKLLKAPWDAEAPPASANLGIPTWVYGHEPPNLFATVSGKYFYNSLREDGLVTLANGGLMFGKGDAGTVQEVFQSLTPVYYRSKGLDPTPLVFFDVNYWDPTPATDEAAGAPLDGHRKPVFPLVRKLATEAKEPFETAVMLSNDPEEIVAFLATRNYSKVPSQRLADVRLTALGA